MERNDVLKQIAEILEDVTDNDSVQITEASTADEVDGWDSLSHIQLVVAIEKHFRIKFTASEIQKWKNVGEMIDSIQAK